MPAISVEQALQSYGYVYDIANAIPDLKTYLTQAIQGGWSQDALVAKIESSTWWKQHADTVRNLAILQATEPATYQQNLNNAMNLVALKAQQLGRSYTSAQLKSLALNQLTTNASWDDQVLSQAVTNGLGHLAGGSGGYSGAAGQIQSQVEQIAQNYGIPHTQAFLNTWINDIESGRNSIDGFTSVAQARAKASYPQFADQIEAGMTVRDIADPYISTMAQTLEIPETAIDWSKDPHITKALSQSTPDGTRTSQPLWQFAAQLKNDPRYDKTIQARTDAYNTLAQVGKDFGFTGGSQ